MARPPRRPGSRYPTQYNVPSQAPSNIPPYDPTLQADASQFPIYQAPHQLGYGGVPPVYVVSTYDARPINATDFTTFSGTNPNDTGFNPSPGSYATASIFYTVQPGRAGVLRDWDIMALFGPTLDGTSPIIGINGTSNVAVSLSFLVDGVFQEAMAGLVLWELPFGQVFGEAYILASEGQTIEMRLTILDQADYVFNQVLMSMHGNLLLSRGDQLSYQPGTINVLPIHEMGTIAIDQANLAAQAAQGSP